MIDWPNRNQGRRRLLAALGAWPFVGASGSASAQPQSSDTVRVGFISHYEPFCMLGPDQRLTGFDVEVVRLLMQRLGLTMQMETGRFEQLRAKVQAGQLDMIGHQLLIIPENRRLFDFVRPYASIQLVCVQHEDDQRDFLSLDDFVGKRLGVLQGTGIEEQARSALGPAVVGFPHIRQGLAALSDRKVDAVLEENLIAEYHIERDAMPLKLGAPMTAPQKVGLAVAKGRTALRMSLSEAVAEMLRQPEFRRVSERWFGHDVSKPRFAHSMAQNN